MKRSMRFVVGPSLLAAFFALAVSAHAQTPFDGTWHIVPGKAKFDPKPFKVYLSEGWFHCVSCSPPYDIQADGQFHPLTGQAFDSQAVKVIDPHTISMISKKGDKTIEEDLVTASADGKVTVIKSTSYPLNGSGAQSSSTTLKRIGTLPSGVHATSGNWVATKFTDTEADLAFTFKSNADSLTMTDPTGDNYTAKFDGADYAFKSYGANFVTLKKVDAHTIVETDKRDAKVISEQKMTVSPDGKTMTLMVHNAQNDTTTTLVATKK
jgi:hypothetical protein